MKPGAAALLLLVPIMLAKRGGGKGSSSGSSSGSFADLKSQFTQTVYKPGTPEQIHLFETAAEYLGLPRSWAKAPSLFKLINSESGGKVGIPNFTYGDRAKDPSNWPEIWEELRNGIYKTNASATGLGQLLASNTDKHYPEGRAGIGDPLNEAVGMLSYINKRWTSPDRAWECYEANACTSGPGISGYGQKNWRGY
jgi:hypothetical protein